MPEIIFICVGKIKEKFYEEAFREYSKRLGAFCKPKLIEIQEEHLPESPSDSEIKRALEREAKLIAEAIPSGAFIISMCVEGGQLSSTELAKLMTKQFVSGYSKIVFIIGGSFGLSQTIKDNSSIKLSMSKMTFPHHLARVMLAEQVYRAFQINLGSAYHK